MAVTKRIDLESVDNSASCAMRTYVLLLYGRLVLVLGKLDGVADGQTAVLPAEPRQQVVHAVALPVPRLGLDDARHLVLHGVSHELAPVALGLGRGRVDVELGVRLPEAGDLEEPLDEFGLVAQLRRCCHREHDPRDDFHRSFNWENSAPRAPEGAAGAFG